MGLDWCLDNPCDAVDAPRVNSEVRAREIWNGYAREQYNYDTFEEFWETYEGKPDCEACRVWREYLDDDGSRGGSFLTSPCEWRGKRLRYTTLPDYLINRAYNDMTPSQMLDYADDLRGFIDNLTDEAERETVTEAANWLEFWAEQGVSMSAWY